MSDKVIITSPVGRLVWGSLYDPQTKDFDGNPLVTKTGPNAGQPRVDYPIGLAIPKTPGATHWAYEKGWGEQIYAVGHAAFPQQAQRPDFAWKITDGDSQVPNKKNRKPCDQEGFPGHWILRFGSGFPPNLFTLIGQPPGKPAAVLEKNAIVAGYFVQVNFEVQGNGNSNNPGIYLNHKMVCLIAYGPVISNGPDPESAGFGATGALPANASYTPPASFTPPAPQTTAGTPPAPLTPPPPQPAAPPPVTPVVPQPAILHQASPPPPPGAPPPPPAAPGRVMLPAAEGKSYESWIAAGWTDALLIQHGKMAP